MLQHALPETISQLSLNILGASGLGHGAVKSLLLPQLLQLKELDLRVRLKRLHECSCLFSRPAHDVYDWD